MDEIERCVLVKQEVFVYNIPPRQSARGYRASDWKLASPDWTGRLRCVTRGQLLEIRLEDKTNGELFAACPVEQFPGRSVEAVTDSSRYFVICVQDAGRKAYIGIGFSDRSDSFDLNVSLQEHFKYLKQDQEEEKASSLPKLDLAFKEGQTIRINIPKKEAETGSKPGSRNRGGGGVGLLPPPPGGAAVTARIPGPANLTPLQSPSEQSEQQPVIGGNLLGDFGNPPPVPAPTHPPSFSDDLWGDFASAPTTKQASSGNWETF